MQGYVPPIDDYRFLMRDVLAFDDAMREIGSEIDADFASTILEEAGRFCADRLAPLNREADEVGAKLIDGRVSTPPGFADAYRDFAAAGWPSLAGDEEWGGQALPFVLQLWFDEMLAASNVSFGLFAALTRGAAEALAAHADDELRATYLTRLVSGEWLGAMALTEGGAGTDLALLRAKAAPLQDGRFAVTGQKIFISSGDHDLSENVVHLVLARLPDAPPGVKGISLFLVPKMLPDEGGSFVVPNGVTPGALEKKMGMHAQPTCVMNYDDAVGWLVGEPNRGLAAMFTMMNAERLVVGVHGLGIAGAAYQQAAAYAKDRLQGRSGDGSRELVAIVEHADVRRMLLNVRSFVEAARALAGWTALQLDRSRKLAHADGRAKADALVALLTPVVKASFTDFGTECAIQAQQVFGGHGYVREWGMEQFVRDARIGQIYEGTNGVQAMDLAARKLRVADGAVVTALLDEIAAELDAAPQTAAFIAEGTREALTLLRETTTFLRGAAADDVGAAAVAYLRLFALTCFGWMWTRMASVPGDDPFIVSKRRVGEFFAAHVLPQTVGLSRQIGAGGRSVMSLAADDF